MYSTKKSRTWCAILYTENLRKTWASDIQSIFDVPFCYIIHHPEQENKKEHVHLMVVYKNTVTGLSVFKKIQRLSKLGERCCSTIEPVVSVENMYEYFIHNTEEAKQQGKIQYSPEERICGNGFDINNYIKKKRKSVQEYVEELSILILQEKDIRDIVDIIYLIKVNYKDTESTKLLTVLAKHIWFFKSLLHDKISFYKGESCSFDPVVIEKKIRDKNFKDVKKLLEEKYNPKAIKNKMIFSTEDVVDII